MFIHFAVITIPKKTHPLDLAFWRDLINGAKTKKAISLFASAADIFDASSRKFFWISYCYGAG